LANEPFQLIIRAWQAFHIVAGEQAPPEAAEDLSDVIRNLLIFGVVSAASHQINQVLIHSLSDASASFGWIALRVQQVLQVDQPLSLSPIPLSLSRKR
jgi:hypothetical protein